MSARNYQGLEEDLKEGLGPTAKMILDAKVFGLIPEEENCVNWRLAEIQTLYDQVSKTWEAYGHLPSRLPDDLRARHGALFDEAMRTARANGWDPDKELNSGH